jgi:arylsulfatase A-like enzyme
VKNGMAPKGPYMAFLSERGLAATHLAMYQPHLGKPGWLNFPAVTELPDDAYCDNWVADIAARFLRAFPAGRPWHLVVNFVGPHGPFDVTPAMHERWSRTDIPPPVNGSGNDAATIAERRRHYAAMIENIDAHVGRLISLVAERGELDNTIIVYASDHGEMLGDHDRWAKSTWHAPSAGIPLIVAGPGIRRGIVSDVLVPLHDLAATFLDYGAAAPLPDSDARSLRAVLDGTREHHRDVLHCGLKHWDMLCDARYKCVRRNGEAPILFDRLDDPHDLRDCAAERPEVVRRMAALLEHEYLQRAEPH